MPAHYDFVTLWRAHAPIDVVWPQIVDAEHWPEWWHAVARAEVLERGDASGLGARTTLSFRTPLGYSLSFETRIIRLEPPHIMEAQAAGELEGRGLWTLTSEDDGTLVRYDWNVVTNRAWMNLLAPLLRPAFSYNHDAVMRSGAEGLAKRLGVAVDDVS